MLLSRLLESVTIASVCVPRMCVSMCVSVCVRRLWITLSPVWIPHHPQTSHTVLSSCWNPWRKTIPDNHLVPTFYKLNLGGCPRQHIMSVTETWALSIGIVSCNEIHRSVCTTSNQQQVPFCRYIHFYKQSIFVSHHSGTVTETFRFVDASTSARLPFCHSTFVNLHCTVHTRHTKFSYPCRDWFGWRCSSEDPHRTVR